MTLSDVQLVLSLLKLAGGRLERAVTALWLQLITQSATSENIMFPKTESSSLGPSPQATGVLGVTLQSPDLHQQVSLAILWTSTLRLKH